MKSIKLQLRREPKLEQEKQVSFYVSVSPFFLPDSLEGEYNDDTGVLAIYFRYPNREPARDLPQDNFVTLSVGQKTNKLLAIKLNVGSHEVDGVNMVIEGVERAAVAIDKARANQPKMAQNYAMAAQALRDSKSEIAKLVHA